MNEKDGAAVIRNRIYLLANGKALDIISEMKQEVDEANATLQRIAAYSDDLPPNMQGILGSLRLHLRGAEKIVPSLGALEDSLAELEKKPGMQRYKQVQKELKNLTLKPAERNTFQSELQSLKAIYARELSEMVSRTHQEIVHRLNLIQYWKSMIYIEIRFYEEIKQHLLKQILNQSHLIVDDDFQEYLQEKLDTLREHMIVPEPSKVSRAALQVANLAILKETLKHHLNEVVHLESVTLEKKETLRRLGEVIQELETKLGIRRTKPEGIAKEKRFPKPEMETKTSTPPLPTVLEKDTSKSGSRMIFTQRKKY